MPSAELFRHRVGSHNLHGVAHLPDESGAKPAVVICHGFKGFMDWGFFPYLAELLADRGFVAIRFNLSGSGMKPGDELVSFSSQGMGDRKCFGSSQEMGDGRCFGSSMRTK